MFAHLLTAPDGANAIQSVIAELDGCFLHGFVGTQYPILAKLPLLFAGTPLQSRMQVSVEALNQNLFTEAHFLTLAAARSALQGTLYDLLRTHGLTALGRAAEATASTVPAVPSKTDPLLDSARHWLMELAMTGFARLEPAPVASFSTTLAQIRIQPQTSQQGLLLTGFLNELLAALPVKSADEAPLLRWCDLWSSAMLNTVGSVEEPIAEPVSGTLYPLGVELRQHSRAASLVLYALLLTDDKPLFVRQTWSTFKASAIRGDEVWLLFPDAQPLLQHLVQGQSVIIQDMPMSSSGDLAWNPEATKVGKKFKVLDIALEYCAMGKPIVASPAPPLARHPIQLAEPIALSDYQVEDNRLRPKDDGTLALDTKRSILAIEALAEANALFGLLRYDAGEWSIQVLAASSRKGKAVFAGQAGLELLKKPPKTSAVSILQERASRLLRK